MPKKTIYRIIFANQDVIYEIYAQKITESELFGFLEVEEFVFGENRTVVVDPSEERLKTEFKHVVRTYIPSQAIFRIDEVSKEGASKIRDKSVETGKVALFPVSDKR